MGAERPTNRRRGCAYSYAQKEHPSAAGFDRAVRGIVANDLVITLNRGRQVLNLRQKSGITSVALAFSSLSCSSQLSCSARVGKSVKKSQFLNDA